MTNERLVRAFAADLEVRGDGRTICGLCVPYDTATEIRGMFGQPFMETFARGAFARTIAERGPERVKLLDHHDDHALPLGRATLLREDAAGLYGEFHVSQTQRGDEVLTLARDGVLTGLSIGFEPKRDEWTADRSAVTRLEARLWEVSTVNFPAYEAGQVAAVRSAEQHGTPLLNAARMRLDLLRKASA